MQIENHTRSDETPESHWVAFWRRWMPTLIATPLMLAAYVATAIVLPTMLESTTGFVASLSLVTIAATAAISLVYRAVGVYASRRDIVGTSQRQGITSSQLAVMATWLIFPRMGVIQTFWSYAIAFMLVGVIGALVATLVAGRDGIGTSAAVQGFKYATKGPSQGRVAPKWVQRIAALCLIFGVLSFVRLFTDGTQHFLWGGIILIVVGIALPSLVVALGGGTEQR